MPHPTDDQARLDSTTPPLAGPSRLLRLEGAAMALAAITLFATSDPNWWLFAGVVLLPDAGLLGYLLGPEPGARCYNATHTLVIPLTLAVIGIRQGIDLPVDIAVIWTTHIGVDRAAGFGLKFPDSFRRTHLQRLDDSAQVHAAQS